jgi:hypothetical protein
VEPIFTTRKVRTTSRNPGRLNEKMLTNVKSKEKSAMNVFLIQKNKIRLKETLINTTEKQKTFG